VGRPEEKKPLGRSNRRWEYNIKIYFQELRWGDILWVDLAQDRDRWRALVNAIMNLRFHKMRGISRLAQDLSASQEGFVP
jgi:ERCC4-type nuclease